VLPFLEGLYFSKTALATERRHPMKYIAFDSHKRYTWVLVESREGRKLVEKKLPHEPGMIKSFLEKFEPGSPVALETVGNWYWIVDEIEAASMVPRLVNALKAKLMLGAVNKTDKLDVRGLNRLQRAGTLPTVWIPSGEIRDARDLPRTCMVLAKERTRLKNRIHVMSRFMCKFRGCPISIKFLSN